MKAVQAKRAHSSRTIRLLQLVAGILPLGIIIHQIVIRAGNKLFWFDEAVEVFRSCSRTFSDIAIHGAADQCSSVPLYYLLQKAVVDNAVLSGDILYSFRAVSIVSAGITLIVLFAGFTRYAGALAGLFALLVLNNQDQLHLYGAENRPYMLWVCLFTSSLMLVSALAYRPWNSLTAGSKLAVACLLLALALAAGPGMVQAAGFLFALSVWEKREILHVRDWTRIFSKFQISIAIVCCLIGLYYTPQVCLQFNGGSFDLMKTGRWQLIGDVLADTGLWPPPGRTGLMTAVFDLFCFIALAKTWLLWKERHHQADERKFILSVTATAIIQLFCAVVLGILLAVAGYYFVPRMFIYLMILRTVLVVSGAYWCVLYIFEQWHSLRPSLYRPRLLKGIVFAAVVLALSRSLFLTYLKDANNPLEERPRDRLVLTDTACPPTPSSLALMDVKAPSEEYPLNFIVAFDEQLQRCGWVSAEAPQLYVVPTYLPNAPAGYRIEQTLPAGLSSLGRFHGDFLNRRPSIRAR